MKRRGQPFFASPARSLRAAVRCFALGVLGAAVVAGCAAPQSEGAAAGPAIGFVKVRLMHLELPVPGVQITAARNLGIDALEERVVARAGADGSAELRLPPGSWYLAASAADPPLFGWYGSNPVLVKPGDMVELTIPATPASSAVVESLASPGEESVEGVVVGDDGAVAGAGVAFYLDASTLFRGPGYLETQSDERGAFWARLSPGRYWLVARRRSGAKNFGPLEAGDDFGFYPGNPLLIRAGERVSVRLPVIRVLKKSGWSGPSALRARVSGTIRDASGRPVPGHRAFLHAKAAMLGKPEFVSEPSGPDGSYLIWVDRAGEYYLGSRAEIGRPREEREVFGVYAGSPDHAVTVRLDGGELSALDIVVGNGGAP